MTSSQKAHTASPAGLQPKSYRSRVRSLLGVQDQSAVSQALQLPPSLPVADQATMAARQVSPRLNNGDSLTEMQLGVDTGPLEPADAETRADPQLTDRPGVRTAASPAQTVATRADDAWTEMQAKGVDLAVPGISRQKQSFPAIASQLDADASLTADAENQSQKQVSQTELPRAWPVPDSQARPDVKSVSGGLEPASSIGKQSPVQAPDMPTVLFGHGQERPLQEATRPTLVSGAQMSRAGHELDAPIVHQKLAAGARVLDSSQLPVKASPWISPAATDDASAQPRHTLLASADRPASPYVAAAVRRGQTSAAIDHLSNGSSKRVERLEKTVKQLESQVADQSARLQQAIRQQPQAPTRSLIIVNQPAASSAASHAFWHRSYLGRFHLRPRR